MIANYCMLKYVEELNIELQLQVQQKHLPHNSMSFRLQLSLEMTQSNLHHWQVRNIALLACSRSMSWCASWVSLVAPSDAT